MARFSFKMDHVGIFVSDLDRSIQWYEEILGFKLVHREMHDLPVGRADMCWLKGYGFYLELYQFEEKQEEFDIKSYFKTLGTKHFCLCVPDEEFEAVREFMYSRNDVTVTVDTRWPEEKTKKPGGEGVIYIADPDGIEIEIEEIQTPGEYGEAVK